MLHFGVNLSTFCPYPETFQENKVKGCRLINLTENFKKANIQAVA